MKHLQRSKFLLTAGHIVFKWMAITDVCWFVLQLSARGDILKHFLLLVLIMDATVTDQSVKLPKDIPPLFSIAAKYKSSKEASKNMFLVL